MHTTSPRAGVGVTPLASIVVVAIIISAGCVSSSTETWKANTPTALRVDPTKIIDLSYSLGPETIYWPTAAPVKELPEANRLLPDRHGR
jgi:hypothetical protein